MTNYINLLTIQRRMKLALKRKGLLINQKLKRKAEITRSFIKKAPHSTEDTIQLFFKGKDVNGMIEIPLHTLEKLL